MKTSERMLEEEIVELDPTASYEEIGDELDRGSYEYFCHQLDFLTHEDDPKSQALFDTFRKGWKKEYSRIMVSVEFVPIKDMHPTQNIIYAKKSIRKLLNGDYNNTELSIDEMLSSPNPMIKTFRPIVICIINGVKYIIDGHHRWSKVYAFNPNARMKAYVIQQQQIFRTPDDVLKFAQGTITSLKGTSPINEKQPENDFNLYTIGEADFRKIVTQAIEEKDGPRIMARIMRAPLARGIITDGNTLADFLWNNIMTMREDAQIAEDHDRKYMPQFKKDDGTPSDAVRKIAAESLEPDLMSSFDINDGLCSIVWDEQQHLRPEIRDRLIQIARDFVATIENDFPVEKIGNKPNPMRLIFRDVILVGSMTSFNYSQYSDLDVHILVNLSFLEIEDPAILEMCKKYFWHCKKSWNEAHPGLRVKGFGVELYVQDESEENATNGIYSLLQDKWLKTPEKMEGSFDQTVVSDKAQSLMDKIDWMEHRLQTTSDQDVAKKILEMARALKDSIFADRKNSINGDEGDEMANDNIVFKILRRTGHLDKLNHIIDNSYDMGNTLIEFLSREI